MEMLFIGLVKLLGSAGFGTIFGGIMGFFNRKADLEYKKLEYADKEKERAHELKQRELDASLMEKEWAGRVQVANVEGESRAEVAAFDAMAASYEFAKPKAGGKMEAFSTFVRPFISIAYFLISSVGAMYIIYHIFHIESLTFSSDQWLQLAVFVIEWMAFMSGTTIGWWFAMRAGKPPRLGK